MRKNLRKSQATVEFIGGFVLFAAVVIYVAFSIINALPTRYDAIDDNVMRLKAWKTSENFMRLAEADGTLDDGKMSDFVVCDGYNYNDLVSRQRYDKVASLLNISDTDTVHITLEEFPVAVLDGDSAQKSGTVSVNNIAYGILTRNLSLIFNETSISGAGGPWIGAGGAAGFGGTSYSVESIGPRGDYVIFKRVIISCGP